MSSQAGRELTRQCGQPGARTHGALCHPSLRGPYGCASGRSAAPWWPDTPRPRPVVQPPGAALTGDGLGVASASARAPSGDRQSPGGLQTRRPREPGGHLPLLGPGVGEPAALRPRPLADRKPRLASAHRGRKLVPETGASSRPQRRCRGEERHGRWGPGPQVLPQASAGPGARPPGPAVTPAGERSSPCPARGAVVWAGWPWPRREQGQQGPQGDRPRPGPGARRRPARSIWCSAGRVGAARPGPLRDWRAGGLAGRFLREVLGASVPTALQVTSTVQGQKP